MRSVYGLTAGLPGPLRTRARAPWLHRCANSRPWTLKSGIGEGIHPLRTFPQGFLSQRLSDPAIGPVTGTALSAIVINPSVLIVSYPVRSTPHSLFKHSCGEKSP